MNMSLERDVGIPKSLFSFCREGFYFMYKGKRCIFITKTNINIDKYSL